MLDIKLKLSTVLMLGLGLPGLQAQESIATTGGNALDSGGTMSYSVGQVVYKTNMGSNGTEAQGVQQPFEISVVTGLEEAKGIDLSVSAYPNPVADYLTLSVDNLEISNLSYRLYHLNGTLLETKKIEDSQTNISMSILAPAIYVVEIIEGGKKIKTFIISKN